MINQGSTAGPVARSVRPAVRKKRSIDWMPYLFIAPTVLLIVGFLFYPLLKVFYYSLQNYNLSKPYYNGFVGLDNFKRIFTQDELFYPSLLLSVKWVLSNVVGQLVFGLIAALLLNQSFRFRSWFRSAAILPWAISGVITSLMWSLIFNQNMGILNDLLLNLGVIEQSIAWTSNEKVVFSSVVVAELWRGIPFFMITMLAALQTIPGELYEACTVDGGGRRRAFYHITLPYLRNTIMLTTLLRAVWEFNNVDLIYNMTGGGPANKTLTLPLYIANEAIASQNFGYGSALTVVAFVILTLFAIGYLKLGGFGKED